MTDHPQFPPGTDPSLIELVNVSIDAQGEAAAKPWLEEIAPLADDAAREWWFEHGQAIPLNEWETIYKPALLWRFYTHLSEQLKRISEGHEELFYNAIREGK